jgi:sugar fermentation stimulation protein A
MEFNLGSCQIRFGQLVGAELVQRDNRFRVQVRMEGRVVSAHLPNSGRLGELLVPGRQLWLTPAPVEGRAERKTAYDLTLVEYGDRLVSVDARLPSALVAAALSCGRLARWQGYATVQREVTHGASRLDLRLDAHPEAPPCWIEVKSVTLVEEGAALFPDAPTARGRRHLAELVDIVDAGGRAAAVFVVQRDDPERFSPHSMADPAFAAALCEAKAAGVDVAAYRCRVTLEGIEITSSIPVVV